MKKTALLLSVLLGMPLLASAHAPHYDNAPGAGVHIGDRDHRGYYWDGYDWRPAKWWQAHHGRNVGLKGPHGYWNGNGWQAQRPDHDKPMAKRDNPSHNDHPTRNDREPVPPRANHN
ncbi:MULTISPECIES: DUF2502 domain-containing protein [Pantoea]|jgi:hypothetical protein|uniref:DUF2502 domain-containing protein n=1 Tax=Pantoea TaxID=53335 RepID=UPI000EA2D704|nr:MULTISPECIES: DUF2502 domain-containing protein [Pantoea]MBZ6385312.1 DUF2502 domain-containing protein [Pantoea piersonii]MBZ6401685.1 DUF2502 domain-containing protein [Pantoea piersonii]MBZ6408255.1 DUF2502 domain-containing protein [Pantoea piersonii]MBZ6427321.1 DUF2502 domain-containing protein [Pantoea piersonii]NYB03903.1 DUF2502 domain-containing protein [Pantoea piersonii]